MSYSPLSNLKLPKTKAELFVFGYVRYEQSRQKSTFIPDDIISSILKFYPTKYSVYGIGQQFCGQFGLSHKNTLSSFTKLSEFSSLIQHPDDITDGWFKYIINDTNNPLLYSAGNNNYGQCGVINYSFEDDIVRFTKMNNKNFVNNKNKLKLISSGSFSNHCMMVYDDKIIGIGCNANYQFGIKYANNDINSHPILIKNILNNLTINKIVCGKNHTLILTSNGFVYSMGLNDNGQCGLSSIQFKYVTKPTLIDNVNNIIDIDAGSTNNLLINDEHNLYVFGNNEYGQLLNCDNKIIDRPILNDYFLNINVNKINCGLCNSLVIDNNNKCYLFGNNTFGQIGNGQDKIRKNLIPYKLSDLLIADGQYGDWHCILLTIYNEIYSFGSNSVNQCSKNLANKKNVLKPYHVKKSEIGIKQNDKIQRVIAGGGCTLIVCDAE